MASGGRQEAITELVGKPPSIRVPVWTLRQHGTPSKPNILHVIREDEWLGDDVGRAPRVPPEQRLSTRVVLRKIEGPSENMAEVYDKSPTMLLDYVSSDASGQMAQGVLLRGIEVEGVPAHRPGDLLWIDSKPRGQVAKCTDERIFAINLNTKHQLEVSVGDVCWVPDMAAQDGRGRRLLATRVGSRQSREKSRMAVLWREDAPWEARVEALPLDRVTKDERRPREDWDGVLSSQFRMLPEGRSRAHFGAGWRDCIGRRVQLKHRELQMAGVFGVVSELNRHMAEEYRHMLPARLPQPLVASARDRKLRRNRSKEKSAAKGRSPAPAPSPVEDDASVTLSRTSEGSDRGRDHVEDAFSVAADMDETASQNTSTTEGGWSSGTASTMQYSPGSDASPCASFAQQSVASEASAGSVELDDVMHEPLDSHSWGGGAAGVEGAAGGVDQAALVSTMTSFSVLDQRAWHPPLSQPQDGYHSGAISDGSEPSPQPQWQGDGAALWHPDFALPPDVVSQMHPLPVPVLVHPPMLLPPDVMQLSMHQCLSAGLHQQDGDASAMFYMAPHPHAGYAAAPVGQHPKQQGVDDMAALHGITGLLDGQGAYPMDMAPAHGFSNDVDFAEVAMSDPRHGSMVQETQGPEPTLHAHGLGDGAPFYLAEVPVDGQVVVSYVAPEWLWQHS